MLTYTVFGLETLRERGSHADTALVGSSTEVGLASLSAGTGYN